MVEKLNIPLFILAGGRATRLKGLSESLPKYLMPVSDTETFADYHLRWAKKVGFSDIILSVGYLAEQVINYCGNGEKWGLNIKYVNDGNTPLGTGGATKSSLKYEYDYLALTYGDTLLNFDVQDCINKTIQSKALACMTVYKNEVPGHACNARLLDTHKTNFSGHSDWIFYDKKNPHPEWQFIDYGFSVLKREFIQSFPNSIPLDLAEPFTDLAKNEKLLGYLCTDRFWEIGSPEALHEFQKKFK